MEFGNVRSRSVVPPAAVYRYVAGLERLKYSLPDYTAALAHEMKMMPPPAPELFSLIPTCDGRLQNDRYSTSLVHRYLGGHGVPYTAAATTAEGSCLFNAASLLIKGTRLFYSYFDITKIMGDRRCITHHKIGDGIVQILGSGMAYMHSQI